MTFITTSCSEPGRSINAGLTTGRSQARRGPPLSMKGTLVSRTVSGAVFGILFGHQSLKHPLWAQPFCDSPIVRIRPCTGWDWIVLDRSIYPFVLASKKRELVDAAHDLVRCERPSYKEAYGRRSTTATIAGSGWPVPGRDSRELEALTFMRADACLCPGSRRRFVRSCRSMDFDVVEPGRPGGVSV